MKFIKTIGIAAIAVTAAMAFVGASSAMAESTLICTGDPATEACNPPASVHYVATNATLVTSLGTITCASALLSGTVGALGAPEHITYAKGGLTYSSCVFGKSTSCNVEETTSGGLLDVLKEGTELASVIGLGAGGIGRVEVHAECGSLINCTYGSEELKGHGLGALVATNGHVTYTKAIVTKTGGVLCPKTSELTALFESLTPLYIGS